MSEQIEYKNIFEHELIKRTGTVDVISDDRMTQTLAPPHVFRFNKEFVRDLKRSCSC